jgi:polyphosphate kinase
MDLVVRTTYAMLPHRNIRAISILDRYLEHQRVFIFGEGRDRCVYLSSCDLMERNLDWRVEVAFPILSLDTQQQVAEMMKLQVADTCKARILDETQSNHYAGDGTGQRRVQYDTHDYLTRASGIG